MSNGDATGNHRIEIAAGIVLCAGGICIGAWLLKHPEYARRIYSETYRAISRTARRTADGFQFIAETTASESLKLRGTKA